MWMFWTGGLGVGMARKLALLRGLRPVARARIPRELLAGITLAALAVPEVLGYARIAGMPVQAGLYTMLAPVVVFGVLGASRHLVVGADSATAVILASGLAGMAAPGSGRYGALASGATMIVAGLLLAAWLARIGFLANFLSRTVLAGFLAGAGVTVAVGQLADMLGLAHRSGAVFEQLGQVLSSLGQARTAPVVVSAVVIVVVTGVRRVSRSIPATLIVLVAVTTVVEMGGLSRQGLAVLGPVPPGLPGWELPQLSVSDVRALLPTAASMLVVILAQSAVTARAYAVRYDEQADTDADLLGLAGANLVAGLSGAFVVNGSPTKTQMVDTAGGRSQLAQLFSVAAVVVVVVGGTAPLAALPLAALAAVVFLIGVELIDLGVLHRTWKVRRAEFAVAAVTAGSVVLLGVGMGIVIAVAASIVEHLRHSYAPHDALLVKSPAGHWQPSPVTPAGRTVPGLVVYRFGTSVYFANISRLLEDVRALTSAGEPVQWFCFDCAAIGDIDYTAGEGLARACRQLAASGITVVVSAVIEPVRAQLSDYGVPVEARYETAGAALEAFQARPH